jgi:predicted methyltransferase
MKTYTTLLTIILFGGSAFAADETPSVEAGPLASALTADTRSAEDRARDAGRRPAEVVAFLGITPGMRVIDLIAAGGYYTEVLSLAVGPEGKVYAQNNEYVLKLRDGANERAMTARLADGRLPNVERVDREIVDLGLAPGSLDAALTALNFHDIYNGRHSGRTDLDNAELHRVEESRVYAAAEKAGFTVEAKSDLLRNPDDDKTTNVFDPAIRGKTDRFLVRLRKPH